MSAPPQTPGRAATPRHSGIPTPGGPRAVSGIPTPGRVRSTANTPLPTKVIAEHDADAMRALSDALRANNPAQHRATTELQIPPSDASGRRSVTGRPVYSSRASTSSVASTGSIALEKSTLRPKTPSSATTSTFRSVQTPRSSVSSRPVSRQSDVFRASSRQTNHPKALDLGDPVGIESLGVEGTIQFLGEADFKEGLWAGVELSATFAGRGKNDGSVNG
jgi:CAP-Gly domain-containing linker protein 1